MILLSALADYWTVIYLKLSSWHIHRRICCANKRTLTFCFNKMKKKFLHFLSSTTYVTKLLLVQKASICKTVDTRCKKPLHLSGLDSLLATPRKLSIELTVRVCRFQLKHIDQEQKVTFENQEFFHIVLLNFQIILIHTMLQQWRGHEFNFKKIC